MGKIGEMGARVGVAFGVKTDRRLAEELEKIEDEEERMKKMEKLYKKQCKKAGEACAGAVKNAVLIPTGPVAAVRTACKTLKARASFNNIELIEEYGLQQGVDLHEDGHRKRNIAKGAIKGVIC